MDNFLMKPKVDFAFKEIMTNEKARTGFLSAMLKIKAEDIKSTSILNANLRREHEDAKQGILDVRLLMNDDTEADIEIQVSELRVWAERSLFYLSKMYTGQIAPSQDYGVFKKCVSISILDFDLFHGETEFYSCFHIREDTRGIIYTDKMEFHVVELPKLPEGLEEDSSDIELWAKFINAERKEEFDMLAQRNPYIESAYEHLQVISRDKEKRLEYEAREKALRDYNQLVKEAEMRGKEAGEKIGREDGEKIGREAGEKIGREAGEKIGREAGEKIGREQEAERINNLNARLIQEQRYTDLEHSTRNKDFQKQLMQQYGI